jgi:hypothetical protein
MPRTVIFFEDLILGRERNSWDAGSSIDKEADLVLNAGLLCFYGGYRAWWEAQGPIIVWEALTLVQKGNWGQCAFQCFPQKKGQGPGCSFFWGYSLLKWPACTHWKQVLGFVLCPREVSLSAAIRASCHLSILFSFSWSFHSFSKSLL